jgi:hypothetical protein
MSSFEEIKIDTDFTLLRFQNDSDTTETSE